MTQPDRQPDRPAPPPPPLSPEAIAARLQSVELQYRRDIAGLSGRLDRLERLLGDLANRLT